MLNVISLDLAREEEVKNKLIDELYKIGLCAIASGETDQKKVFDSLCSYFAIRNLQYSKAGYFADITTEEIQELAEKVCAYSRQEALTLLDIENIKLEQDEEDPPVLAKVEPFPLFALPEAFQVFVKQAAAAFNAPVDFFANALLTIAGTAIGNRRALRIKKTWTVKPILWTAIVADPGSAKSPSLGFMFKPIEQIQKRFLEEYRRERQQYLKNQDDDAEKPYLKHIYTTDTTKEKLAEMIYHSPDGLILFQDELVSWVKSMNQYKGGKGNDKEFWLSLWSGKGGKIDRKNEESIIFDESFVSVLGLIQPGVLGELVENNGMENGFINRILFSIPDPVELRYVEDEIDDSVKDFYFNSIMALNNLNSYKELIWADGQAHDNWLVVMEDHYKEINELSEDLRGAWSKLTEYTARIALIIQMLRYISGETKTENIEWESIVHAKAIIDYFKSHARKVYDKLTKSPVDKKVELFLEWMKRKGLKQVTRKQITQYKVANCTTKDLAEQLLRELEARGCGTITTKGKSTIFTLDSRYL